MLHNGFFASINKIYFLYLKNGLMVIFIISNDDFSLRRNKVCHLELTNYLNILYKESNK